MLEEVKIWEILDGEILRQVKRVGLDLEDRIERWLEKDISILSDDLLVIGKQVTTAYGGRIDLLCLDSSGDVTIVELKRDKTPRETTAQVLDYASWVINLSAEEITAVAESYFGDKGRLEEAFTEKFGGEMPEVLNENQHMVVVGSEIDDSSARIISFLSESYGVGINAITFNYFRNGEGKEFLARVFLIEPEQAEANTKKSPKRQPTATIEELCERADRSGTGEGFRVILQAAERHSLYLRTTSGSIRITPPSNRNYSLFVIYPLSKVGEGLAINVYSEVWAKFFGVEEELVASILGPDRYWEGVTYEEAEEFSVNLDRLFEAIEKRNPELDGHEV